MTHAELRKRAAEALPMEPVASYAFADAVLRVVLDTLREVTPCAYREGSFGGRCEYLAAEWIHNADNAFGHAYCLPAHLAVLEENDRGK